jgi:hypothetical protein
MATFADVTQENFQQFQNLVPQLRQFPSVQGFAGTIQNPNFNPMFLGTLQQSLAGADVAQLGQFTPTQTPTSDINFLVRSGQVQAGPSGLFEQTDFSQFGIGTLTGREFDKALGQVRRVSTKTGEQFGVVQPGVVNEFFAGLFEDVTAGRTTIDELRGAESPGSQQFAEFAAGIGLEAGSGIINPFSLGFGESTPGTIAPSGAVLPRTVEDVSQQAIPRTILDTGATTGEEFQDLLQALGRTTLGGQGGVLRPQAQPTGGFPTGGGTTLAGDGGGGFVGGGGGFTGGGGGGGGFQVPSFGGIPGVGSTLREFFQGREALVSQQISDLGFLGQRGVGAVRGAIPELGAAADVAGGAFGQDIGEDFTQALQEAAAIRGLDPSAIGPTGGFNAGLAANQFLSSATALATQTGFEDLMFAGFAPPGLQGTHGNFT